MKTIKFKHDWMYSRQGDVLEEGDGVAEILIQRGIAEEVTTEQVEGDQAKEKLPPTVITRRIPGPRETGSRISGGQAESK